jgi:hypothetical protein
MLTDWRGAPGWALALKPRSPSRWRAASSPSQGKQSPSREGERAKEARGSDPRACQPNKWDRPHVGSDPAHQEQHCLRSGWAILQCRRVISLGSNRVHMPHSATFAIRSLSAISAWNPWRRRPHLRGGWGVNPIWDHMSGADEFRRRAGECRQLAATVSSPVDEAFWLRSAEDWMNVAATWENRNSDTPPH